MIQGTWSKFISQLRDFQRGEVMIENKNNDKRDKSDVSYIVLFKQQAAGIIQRVWKTFLRRKEIKRIEVLEANFSLIYLFFICSSLFGNEN